MWTQAFKVNTILSHKCVILGYETGKCAEKELLGECVSGFPDMQCEVK